MRNSNKIVTPINVYINEIRISQYDFERTNNMALMFQILHNSFECFIAATYHRRSKDDG